ncbi:metal-response element-binding transcription factor 2 [Macrosteles quadrilineatus]|uniref:metal-response element-binding transcription factor 2 n=1 Tax=Macrosteles quadrilineatus TaxID=74068 RepID=UPI0023E2C4F8|nr:metal-response element-binding transcription factor 2 [Macrosteles quadrilineatus]
MSGLNRKRDARDSESPTAPDSTTKDRVFCIGDEVLVQRKDGNFYLGTVVEVNVAQEKCLVKFDDNTDHWSAFKHLAKLNKVENVMCVICKKSQTKKDNEVVVCDRCSRGYHQLCHQPTVELGLDCWECHRCQAVPLKQLRAMRKQAPAPPPAPPPPLSVLPTQSNNKLPYDMEELTWDMHHRVNTEAKYCYCGTPGDWYMKMLQCGRCRQWFHEHCLRCLHQPLYLGDPFYVFVCSLCNNGKEFLRRLEMKWVDLVHLVLFNLTVYKAKKFHDIETDILQYLNHNWNTLQLPPKILNVSTEERKSIILSVLASNLSRFKCGEEVKQKRSSWGLRLRIPPLAPVYSLPKTRPVTEALLHHLKLLPSCGKSEINGVRESHTHLLSPSTTLPCDPPPGVRLLQIQDDPPVFLPKGMPATGHKVCIKSSFPCYPESRAQIQRRIRAQGLKIQRIRNFRARKARKLLKNAIATTTNRQICQELPLTPPSSVAASDTAPAPPTPTPATPGDTSSEDTSSSRTLDTIIPPLKDFEGKNNPFRSVAELLGNTATPEATQPISLNLPLKPSVTQPMLRPTKRRLSEKDIRINRNGEVKRRRLRRQCTVMKNTEQVPSASWNSAKSLRSMYNPTPGSGPEYLNGKKLKKPKHKSLTPTASPMKQNPTISLDDLKSSVNIYFGAANRIASGEKFRVKAKRLTAIGRTEYLIEWGGTVT